LVATDLLSGRGVLVSAGPVDVAVRASAAVPALYPPVRLEGRYLADGGIAHHSGISHAVELGATTIWVLPTGFSCALARPPRTAVGVALHALTLLIEQRLITEVATWSEAVTVKVLPPLCPLAVSAADFGHADELIRRARRSTTSWLQRGGHELPDQERFLGLHHHRQRRAGHPDLDGRPSMRSVPAQPAVGTGAPSRVTRKYSPIMSPRSAPAVMSLGTCPAM
jgi:NTE family protein